MRNITNIKEGQDYLYKNSLNYEIEDVSDKGKECYIFFSSNGIYEDDFDKFYNTMISENRYEWKSIAKSIKKRKDVGRIIYVRDVYKKHYIYGVNKENNSISKLLEKLKEETIGYEVITVGISSGGYMAVVAGCFLNAEKVFSISGQFEVPPKIISSESSKIEESDRGYLNTIAKINEKNSIKIYYFCPIECEIDKKNYEMIKNINNVRCFLFSSNVHADTVYPFNFPDIICKKSKKLDDIARKYNGKVISKIKILVKTFTIFGVWEFMNRMIKAKFTLSNIKKSWDVK